MIFSLFCLALSVHFYVIYCTLLYLNLICCFVIWSLTFYFAFLRVLPCPIYPYLLCNLLCSAINFNQPFCLILMLLILQSAFPVVLPCPIYHFLRKLLCNAIADFNVPFCPILMFFNNLVYFAFISVPLCSISPLLCNRLCHTRL